ncbi:MAG TPA: rhomboid family intramembrane serine protease [Gemmataceae bacterium]|jgi:rhomboid protease GluP|nr:rhomboid family intramembrane serine protease [Gemmataceae bacterium]
MILRRCAEAAPDPWYPSAYARETGITRESLDPYLDQLRLGGLIHLTDWVQGHGQGYALTPEGTEILHSPRLLARVKNGQMPVLANGPADMPPRVQSASTTWERGEAARAAFLSPAVPVVTFVIIGLNVLWFAAGLAIAVHRQVPLNQFVFGSDTRILRTTGDMHGALFYVDHEWWRLLTCAFVHIGLLHLGVNMLSLYWVGPLLETMWGHWRFLVLYVIVAIGGSCGMLIDSPLADAAGASGALWGIMASMGTWLFLNRNALPRALVATWTRQLLIVLALNVALTYGIPGISKGGHFGGGIIGLIAAVPLDGLRWGRGRQRVLALLALIAIPVLCVAYVLPFPKGETGAALKGDDFREHALPRIEADLQAAAAVRADARKLLAEREPDGDRLKETLDALSRRRQSLTAAAERLENAGPFAPERVEAGREYYQKALEDSAEQVASVEDNVRKRLDQRQRQGQVKDFEKHHLPKVTKSTYAAAALYQKTAEPLLARVRPEAGKVKQALAALPKVRKALTAAAEDLEKAGPYSAAQVEKVRQTSKAYVEAWGTLLDLTEERLRHPENEAAKAKSKRQYEQMEKAAQAWDALVQDK